MKKGFTLIELLVVIAIIGVLSSIVIANINQARGRARDVQRVSDMRQLKTALEMYINQNDTYIINTNWPNNCGAGVGFETALSSLVTQGFISKIPRDPFSPTPSTPSDWPRCYYYQSNNTCAGTDTVVHPYILVFQAENPLRGYTSWAGENNRYCVYP